MGIKDILMKNKLDIMTEASLSENYDTNVNMENKSEIDVIATLETIDTFNEEFAYPAESIPVMVNEDSYGDRLYFVEYDMLSKFMEYADIDLEIDAMEDIAEANGIDMSKFYLMIESADYFVNEMREAQSKGGTMLKGTLSNNLIKSVDDLKDQGIKLVKKGSNKKKSKNKKKKRNKK
mgnify:CR=1 FL=1